MIRLFEKAGTTSANIGAATEVELDMETNDHGAALEILRVMVKHVSGSAANFTVRIGNTSGFANGSINQKYLSGSTAVGGMLDDSVVNKANSSGFCTTTSSGKLYIKFGPDAGGNNSFTYSIMYRR